jgi:hypothetical protein
MKELRQGIWEDIAAGSARVFRYIDDAKWRADIESARGI